MQTEESELTPTLPEAELSTAVDLLRNRLDRSLVDNLQAGDFAANLLAYMRQRPQPPLLFAPQQLATIADLARRYDPAEADWEREIADHAVHGRLYGASNAYCRRFLSVDRDTFDFSTYEHHDPQTIRGLNRHRWLASLGRAYWEQQDEQYFQALIREWDFFCAKVPFPDDTFCQGIHAMGPHNLQPPYGELDTYIRLTNWYFAYWLSVYAPPMTPERNAILLARCLQQFDLVAARGIKTHEHNFTGMQMEALYLWAMALPEVTGMTTWKHASRNIMESSLDRAVYEDGVHWERSAGYHAGCLRWYGTSYLLGLRNQQPWATPYGERLQRMATFTDATVTPDGNIPLISDSDRVPQWRTALAIARCIFPDHAFQHQVDPTYYSLWVSNGTTWDREPPRSSFHARMVFPDGGFGILTTPHGERANQLLISNGCTQAGHAHKDNLTICWEAAGKPTLVDPGRWIYRNDDDRLWVRQPDSHNTIIPGDFAADMAVEIVSHKDRRVGDITTGESDDWLSIQTSFAAYRADATATVNRLVYLSRTPDQPWLVVIDTISCTEELTWTNSWLFPAEAPAMLDAQAATVRLTAGNDVNVHWLPGTLAVRDDARFWCPNYGEKAPARWLRLSGPACRQRRIFAFTTGAGNAPACTLSERPAGLDLAIKDWGELRLAWQ